MWWKVGHDGSTICCIVSQLSIVVLLDRVPLQLNSIAHSDLDQVRFDSFAMHLFNQVFAELELIFSNDELDIDLVLKFYGRILVNSFAIQDCFLRPIGRAIYLG